MNRLIIIGNGFDLAHDLKTSYGAFMNDYFKSLFTKIEPINGAVPLERGLTLLSANESNCYLSFKDELIELRVKPKISISRGYLSEIDDELNKLCAEVKKQGFDRWTNKLGYSSHSDFIKSILNDIASKKWIDIESTYFQFLKNHLKNLEDEMIEELNSQLKKIEQKLVDYLSNQQLTPNKLKEEYIQMREILFPKESKGEVCVLNFNYTNTIEHYLENNDSNVIYIHGKLNDEKNPIIFGYGDDHHEDYINLQETGNDELLKYQKSMLYPRTSNYGKMELFLNGLNTKNEEMATSDFEVLILGHSCGLSDRTLLRTIFEHKNCKKIHIAFHKNVNDFDSKVIAISRHFNDKTKMRSRIAPFNEALRIPQFKEYEA